MILALAPLLLLVGTSSALMALDERGISEHERQVLADEYGAGYILPDKLSPQAVKVMADVNGVENVEQFESFLYDDALTFDVEHLEGDIKTTARTVRKRDTDEFEHILTTDTGHKMRIKNPKDLDLDKTRQFAGYFDTPENDHFFFWMFESRHNPQTDPVILWLNGGPGCSSMTGMLFENGPSRIDKNGRTTSNPYSWNNNATIIYLDQPTNVGYSYSTKYVSRTTDAAKDVFVFLSLFFQHFRPLSHRKFHIAGESYAGHYIPAIIDEVEKHKYRRFNVSSVLIGNGLVDPLNQYKSYAPMACGDGEYKQVLTNDACDTLTRETSLCTRLVKTCYSHPNVSLACGGATVLCSALTNAYRKTNLNPYDIREVCKEPPLCYEELSAVEDYMNQDKVRDAVGAEVDKFVSCSRMVQRYVLFVFYPRLWVRSSRI